MDQSYDTDLLQSQTVDQYQYSFVGPLSMQKGCDRAFHMWKIENSIRDEPLRNFGVTLDNSNIGYRGKQINIGYRCIEFQSIPLFSFIG